MHVFTNFLLPSKVAADEGGTPKLETTVSPPNAYIITSYTPRQYFLLSTCFKLTEVRQTKFFSLHGPAPRILTSEKVIIPFSSSPSFRLDSTIRCLGFGVRGVVATISGMTLLCTVPGARYPLSRLCTVRCNRPTSFQAAYRSPPRWSYHRLAATITSVEHSQGICVARQIHTDGVRADPTVVGSAMGAAW